MGPGPREAELGWSQERPSQGLACQLVGSPLPVSTSRAGDNNFFFLGSPSSISCSLLGTVYQGLMLSKGGSHVHLLSQGFEPKKKSEQWPEAALSSSCLDVLLVLTQGAARQPSSELSAALNQSPLHQAHCSPACGGSLSSLVTQETRPGDSPWKRGGGEPGV